MLKIFFISTFLIITLISCSNSVEPFNYERDTPQWLKLKIDSLDAEPNYAGTIVYRYEWHTQFVYHISIPISSCMYCLVYEHNGDLINIGDSNTVNDFHNNKKNQVIVWQNGF